MPFALTVPDGYGYTAAIALGAIPLLILAQGFVVVKCRVAAKIPYPNTYATAEQAKASKEAYKFNCAQRAHANLLENSSQTMLTLLFAGLFYPTATMYLGAIWVAMRALFAYGYITSEKANGQGRLIGGGFWLAQLALIGCSLAAAMKLL